MVRKFDKLCFNNKLLTIGTLYPCSVLTWGRWFGAVAVCFFWQEFSVRITVAGAYKAEMS